MVVIKNNVSSTNLRYTTGRWGGTETPKIVYRYLNESKFNEREFLYLLIKDNSVERPVAEFGNTDTPTVIVDFIVKRVYWYVDGGPNKIFEWTFDDYIKLDIPSQDSYIRYYEKI